MYGKAILKRDLRRLLEYLGRLFGKILDRIEPIVARQRLTENPILPDERLAIFLY